VTDKRKGNRTKSAIIAAAIAILADEGLGALTHRRVAEIAHLSLASTTYHFATKTDLLDKVTLVLKDRLIVSFEQALERAETTGLTKLAQAAALSVAGEDRQSWHAWYEILFSVARSPEGQALARDWYDRTMSVWQTAGIRAKPGATGLNLRVEADCAFGFQMMVLALGLTPFQFKEGFERSSNISAAWELGRVSASDTPSARSGNRSADSIMAAAISLLIEHGYPSISYRAVAERSGVAQSAAAYHFGSVSGLMTAAQKELFAASKLRYKAAFPPESDMQNSLESLTDITSAIFIREATEFGKDALALYSLWSVAARIPDLRDHVRSSIRDQMAGWKHRLTPFGAGSDAASMRLQALFIGQLLRVVTTGSRTSMLAEACAEFRLALRQVP